MADILLKNKDGEEIPYANVDSVRLKTTDGGEAVFTLGGGGGGLDTSDATATAGDMAAGKTAYVKGQKITGSVEVVEDGGQIESTLELPESHPIGIIVRGTIDHDAMVRSGSTVVLGFVPNSTLGDAAASDVAAGKTFTSASGLKITGTGAIGSGGIDTSDATATSDDIAQHKTAYVNGQKITGTLAYMPDSLLRTINMYESNGNLRITNTVNSKGYVDSNSELVVDIPFTESNFGNVSPEDVAAGKTFTSASGLKVTGTMANNGAINKAIDGVISESVTIPAGYTSGGTVSLTGDIEAALAAI